MSDIIDYFLQQTQFDLEKLLIGFEQRIAPELLGTGVKIEYVMEGVRIQVRGYVWSQEPSRYETKYPRDWWQAVKERWFPKWLLERFPIEYKHFIVDARIIYPDFKIHMSKEQHILKLSKITADYYAPRN